MGLSAIPRESLAYVTEPPAHLSPSPQNQNSLPEEGMGDAFSPHEGIPDAFSHSLEDAFQSKKKPPVSPPETIPQRNTEKETE